MELSFDNLQYSLLDLNNANKDIFYDSISSNKELNDPQSIDIFVIEYLTAQYKRPKNLALYSELFMRLSEKCPLICQQLFEFLARPINHNNLEWKQSCFCFAKHCYHNIDKDNALLSGYVGLFSPKSLSFRFFSLYFGSKFTFLGISVLYNMLKSIKEIEDENIALENMFIGSGNDMGAIDEVLLYGHPTNSIGYCLKYDMCDALMDYKDILELPVVWSFGEYYRQLKDSTPIEYAAFFGSVRCFEAIIKNNISISPRIALFQCASGAFNIPEYNKDCFAIAVKYGQKNIIMALEQNCTDFEKISIYVRFNHVFGITEHHIKLISQSSKDFGYLPIVQKEYLLLFEKLKPKIVSTWNSNIIKLESKNPRILLNTKSKK